MASQEPSQQSPKTSESGNYGLLLRKLDEFTRKYYLNQLIRGGLFAIGGVLAGYLLISALEYRFYFPSVVRQILFYGGLASASGVLVWLVGIPLSRYLRFSKTLTHAEAARIIGQHFEEVEDRLLNILQLREQSGGISEAALIQASIDQKIDQIKPVPFSLAVDLGKNRKYLRYTLPPLAVFFFLLAAAPRILSESGERLVRNGVEFERSAPFTFTVEADNLEVIQYEDFQLYVTLQGSALPESVNLYQEGVEAPYRLQKVTPNRFLYTFKKVAEDIDFHLEAAGFASQDYALDVLPTPVILGFELQLDYPSYTGRKDEILKNTGDAVVPIGTEVRWIFRTENTDEIGLRFPDEKTTAQRTGNGEFQYNRRIMRDQFYKIGMANERVTGTDSIAYRIGAIPDQYPTISIDQFEDSTNRKFLYFLGDVGDDYGLRNLNFKWKWEGRDGLGDRTLKQEELEPIGIDRTSTRSTFTYSWDLTQKGLEPGDRITYHFEIWDNDGVNGSKSARTASMTFEMPTLEEYEAKTEQNNEEIKDRLEQALEDITDVQEEIDELREKLMQKQELEWEDRKQLQELLDKQQQVQQNVEEIRETFQENLSEQNDYKQYDERLQQKQELLQQMFEEVLTEEMQQMIEEMEQLLEEMSKEQSLEELQDMELSEEQLENELDRMLDLFKQFELEQKMQDITAKLEDLAKDQEELADLTLEEESDADDSKSSDSDKNSEGDESGENEDGDQSKDQESKPQTPEELKKQQDKLNERFEDLKKDLEEMEKLNEELSEPHELDNMEEESGDLSEQMENTSDQLQESQQQQQSGQQKKSQKSQQNAGQQMEQNAEQMQQMAQQMQQQMDAMQQEQQGEDMQALRQLLDNIIKLSFDQEQLIDELADVRTENPRYVELVQEQHKIREDAEMVEDSLMALASRVAEISTFVTREITEINRNMDTGIENLAERKVREAGVNQQFVMTGMNNLALMLDEVLQQMQQQMANAKPGNQMCQKPGQGQPSPSDKMDKMGNLQQQLNSQLQQLKDGQKPGQRNPMGAKQFAQMAAKQAAIRKALEELGQEMNGTTGEQGELAKELKEIADQMEGTEEDLVNKVFNNEMLMRQQEILTRLLEAEDALREREIDPQRKSNTAQEISRDLPPALEEYLKKRQAEVDLWKTVPADLKPYYRNLVKEYLEGLE